MEDGKSTEIEFRTMSSTPSRMFNQAGIMKRTMKRSEPLSMDEIQSIYEGSIRTLEAQMSGSTAMMRHSPIDYGVAYNGRQMMPIVVIVEVQTQVVKYTTGVSLREETYISETLKIQEERTKSLQKQALAQKENNSTNNNLTLLL